jgi:hypothetical protein
VVTPSAAGAAGRRPAFKGAVIASIVLRPTAMTAGDSVSLPLPRPASAVSVEEALASRRSVRDFADVGLSLHGAAQLLWAAQGITPQRQPFQTRSSPPTTATSTGCVPRSASPLSRIPKVCGRDPRQVRSIRWRFTSSPAGWRRCRPAFTGMIRGGTSLPQRRWETGYQVWPQQRSTRAGLPMLRPWPLSRRCFGERA